VHHHQVFELDLEFADQSADADAAVVHEGLRFRQHQVMTGNPAFDDFSLAAAAAKVRPFPAQSGRRT